MTEHGQANARPARKLSPATAATPGSSRGPRYDMLRAEPDCFCFTRQDFAPGEGRETPVTFFIDPDLPNDVKTVTLSHTFFAVQD